MIYTSFFINLGASQFPTNVWSSKNIIYNFVLFVIRNIGILSFARFNWQRKLRLATNYDANSIFLFFLNQLDCVFFFLRITVFPHIRPAGIIFL